MLIFYYNAVKPLVVYLLLNKGMLEYTRVFFIK